MSKNTLQKGRKPTSLATPSVDEPKHVGYYLRLLLQRIRRYLKYNIFGDPIDELIQRPGPSVEDLPEIRYWEVRGLERPAKCELGAGKYWQLRYYELKKDFEGDHLREVAKTLPEEPMADGLSRQTRMRTVAENTKAAAGDARIDMRKTMAEDGPSMTEQERHRAKLHAETGAQAKFEVGKQGGEEDRQRYIAEQVKRDAAALEAQLNRKA